MYSATSLKAAFISQTGWRQNADPLGWQIEAGSELLDAESGLYFNDYHPLLAMDNLISIAPKFELIDQAQAAIDTAFTAWLKEKTEAAIITTIEQWFSTKSELKTAANLLARKDLFTVSGNLFDFEAHPAKMVFIEIKPTKSLNLRSYIEKFSLTLDTNQTFNVYLFKSGTLAPIKTHSAVYTGNGSTQWFTPATNWELKGEGTYYIAYDASLLAGNAINGVKDYNYHSSGYTYFPDGKFYLATAGSNDDAAGTATLWNPSGNNYTLSTNYGLNASISVHCDYTDFIVEQKDLFKTAIALQVAMSLLREMAFNPQSRINRNESNITRSELLFDIDGDTQGNNENSVAGRFKTALNAIHFDVSQIDETCLPCKKTKVTYKAIGPTGRYYSMY